MVIFIFYTLLFFIYCIFMLIVVTTFQDRKMTKFNKKVDEISPSFWAELETHLKTISSSGILLSDEIEALEKKLTDEVFITSMDRYYNTLEKEHVFYEAVPVFMSYFKSFLLKNMRKHTAKDHVKHIHKIYQLGLYRLDDEEVIDYLLDAMETNSLYCKYNAIRALSQIGNEKAFIRAFEILSHSSVMINQKVLLDVIGNFNGDKDALYDGLVEGMNRFNDYQKSLVIESCTFNKKNYKEEFEKIILDGINHDKEVVISLIRYFSRVYSDKAYDEIVRYLKHEEWEYRAVAAMSLSNYKSSETLELLCESVCDRNWYVRSNSSSSIVRMDDSMVYVNKVLEFDDRYAVDSMKYILSARS